MALSQSHYTLHAMVILLVLIMTAMYLMENSILTPTVIKIISYYSMNTSDSNQSTLHSPPTVIHNIYDTLDRDISTIPTFYANGMMRTGSTMLYNILRILIREKIDPNLVSGYLLHSHHAYRKVNFVTLDIPPTSVIISFSSFLISPSTSPISLTLFS